MKGRKARKNNLIFALDIGTRSIVGVVGEPSGGKLNVLAVETAEHSSRTMIDGQIDNIRQVADLARTVTKRLEDRLKVSLTRVCVAAAGRALQTQKGSFALDLSAEENITAELVGRLEAGAVSNAEEALQAAGEDWRQMFLVGYTVAQYRLDNYPLSVLLDHKGKHAEVDVVATFLPGEVVESLYAAMNAAGLQIASMTLEPIAAMNAAIPAELRLLNLALVDIGAGTTDIAVCRDGSVVGYTMATVAGDEITETIMQTYLVDFATAEAMKRNMREGESVTYSDILGLENTVTCEELATVIQEPMERLAQAIARQVMEVNAAAPSALFLAGGGSKLCGLLPRVAECLGMDKRRVAVAGNNFEKSAFSKEVDLKNPEYTTPLGIAVSAALGLLNDSYVISLNGKPAKLFRSGVLTVRDVLLMNGFVYQDMIGRTGRNLTVTLDGRRVQYRGEPATPAILMVNDAECSIGTVVHAGDRISFTPARPGRDARVTLEELLASQPFTYGRVLLNNRTVPGSTFLNSGDVVLALEKYPIQRTEAEEKAQQEPRPEKIPEQQKRPEPEFEKEPEPEKKPEPEKLPEPEKKPDLQEPDVPKERIAALPMGAPLEVLLNGEALVLQAKADNQPFYLMDLLEYSGIDFDSIDRPIRLTVNGRESGFQQIIRTNDTVEICFEDSRR